MPVLSEHPTLAEFQKYVVTLKEERGFKDDLRQAFILFMGESGELAQALRKTWGPGVTDEARADIAHEMADLLIYLFDLANQCGVDLEEAFRAKEEINKARTWKKHHRY